MYEILYIYSFNDLLIVFLFNNSSGIKFNIVFKSILDNISICLCLDFFKSYIKLSLILLFENPNTSLKFLVISSYSLKLRLGIL